jgi:hypothetical protein
VVGKADCTHRYVYEGDNGHGERAFVHVDNGSPISQWWLRFDVPSQAPTMRLGGTLARRPTPTDRNGGLLKPSG